MTLKSTELVCGFQDRDFNTEAAKHKDLVLTWVGDVVVARRIGPLMCALVPIGQVATMVPISQDLTATEIMRARNAGVTQVQAGMTDRAGLLKEMLEGGVDTIQQEAGVIAEWAARQAPVAQEPEPKKRGPGRPRKDG